MTQLNTDELITAEKMQALDWVPAMIWVADTKGQCQHVNLAWQEFTGRSREESLGLGWLSAMHPEDATAWPEKILKAILARESFVLECRLRRRDGRYRWLMKSGKPIYGERGRLIGFIGCCSDVTEQRQALDALRKASEKHRSVLSNLREAVGVIENFLHTEDPGHQGATQDDRLTPRQREILQLIARGYATREIALQLHVSTKTVESHRAQLMQRLNIHDVAGLTRYAIRTGLVQPDF